MVHVPHSSLNGASSRTELLRRQKHDVSSRRFSMECAADTSSSGHHHDGGGDHSQSCSSSSADSADSRLSSVIDEMEALARADNAEQQEQIIASQESAAVSRWRMAVVVMLLVTAALVVTSTYVFLSRSKEREFVKSFQQSAQTIMDAAEFTARNNIQTMESLADSLTSEALTVNATWPYFTSQHFEVLAAHARIASFSEAILFMPFVKGMKRKSWERYSLQHAAQWISESQELGKQTAVWLQEKEYYRQQTTTLAAASADEEGEEKEGKRRRRRRRRRRAAAAGAPNNRDLAAPRAPEVNDMGVAERIYVKAEDHEGGRLGDVSHQEEIPRLHYAPVWQVSPPPIHPKILNYNFLSDSVSARLFNAIEASGGQVVVSEILKKSTVEFLYDGLMTTEQHYGYHDSSQNSQSDAQVLESGSFPHSASMAPVYRDFSGNKKDRKNIVGYVTGIAPWDLYLSRLLPEGVNGVYAVLSNSCAQEVTYLINGPVAVYLGKGDLHEPDYDSWKETLVFTGFGSSNEASRKVGQCDYILTLYASQVYRQDFDNKQAVYFTLILSIVFLATGAIFFMFVIYVQRRQDVVMASALRTNAIVSSLFPTNVRDRIMAAGAGADGSEKGEETNAKDKREKQKEAFLRKDDKEFNEETMKQSELHAGSKHVFGSAPIADLFPETTLMFADLVGFTAWSSVREPTQVFTLLETIYHSFDQLAQKRRIFKVETVGDCYVAAAGLPEPRRDHAVVMCRFAKDCQDLLGPLVKDLETSLGPDTGDLSMRFGLHSGPVTAGVLRGDRARFQLFGDTMNTASRVETTGKVGRIHISKETADLLVKAGKAHWLVPRTDKVVAKGKGELETFWLEIKSRGTGSVVSSADFLGGGGEGMEIMAEMDDDPIAQKVIELDDKTKRLINWNVDLFLRLLRQVEARRRALKIKAVSPPRWRQQEGATVIDEVREIVHLPTFNAAIQEVDEDKIDLGHAVEKELRDYVTAVATMYRANPFHSFEHASHVTMSVVKLMSRIVQPKSELKGGGTADHATLHDYTFGITSDPLTQFACVFSALIHDADHQGVQNSQLVQEDQTIAAMYKNKSVAEQNSVDLCWDLLMDDRYGNLRQVIFANVEERQRFRALVVNSVMATDIMDKDLKNLRNARWDKAFSESFKESEVDSVNRKATIVIEHLIQASDVSHTMQHWHIYRKWNQRLFEEMYKAYREGRSAKNPADFWYQGEIGFFDFYIIPLAKKLKDCGVFGVSSVEYLNYAEKNRSEWEAKGKEVVAGMIQKIRAAEDDEKET